MNKNIDYNNYVHSYIASYNIIIIRTQHSYIENLWFVYHDHITSPEIWVRIFDEYIDMASSNFQSFPY